MMPTGIFVTTIYLVATAAASPELPPGHVVEIKQFASTLTIAKAASDLCADIEVNTSYLNGLIPLLHITEADKEAIANESKIVAAALSQGLAESPRKTWCDSAYRLYGPFGSLIPGLMRR